MKRLSASCALLLFLPLVSLAASHPKYKGLPYEAIVASPPGLYSKTRMFALVENALREVRLSKAPSANYPSGARIAFIAQEKEDGGASFLLANPKSISLLVASATSSFAYVETWPAHAGTYRFNGEVVARNRGILAVRLGGVEGEVLAPAALTASLQVGDVVAVEGYVSPGVRPRAVLPSPQALTLFKPLPPPVAAKPVIAKLPWPAAVGLIVLTAVIGGFAYLRHQRLKRLELVSGTIDKDEETW